MLDQLIATRYVVPLREGGSLPAVVDTEPPGRYVVKFRGAGQGPRALIAELLVAGLGAALGLPIPQPAIVMLDEGFGRAEPDPEIQDLLRGSVGANFGLEYLPGALGFDMVADRERIDPALAAAVVWFDAYVSNVDRTPRNPNLLMWRDRVWLIDHGAALYFHHSGQDWVARAQTSIPQIRDHILLCRAGSLQDADARLRPVLSVAVIRQIVAEVPDEWLIEDGTFPDRTAHREAYVAYLLARLEEPRSWLEEAVHAQQGC